MLISEAFPVCGHISEVYARLQKLPTGLKKSTYIIIVYTPFGQVDCVYIGGSIGWKISSGRHTMYIPDGKVKAQIFSTKGIPGPGIISAVKSSISVPWGVLRNPKYKFRKAKRKSQAICPGLDLRPLQQEFHRNLGDLHRLKHALNRARQLYPRAFWDSFNPNGVDFYNIKEMEKWLRDKYQYDKARMIAVWKEKQNEGKDL